MRFGRFDDAAGEYVVERPDTPRPWSNYIGSRKYGGIITNNAGGYSFVRSPGDGRFMRFRHNSVPLDQAGRYFYLRDRDSKDVWSNAWQPVGKPLTEYKTTCRFGTSYAIIDSEYQGIRTETKYFVPLDQEFEYWWMKVTNTGKTARKLSVFSFAEFTSEWNLVNDLLNLQYIMYIAQARFEDGIISASSAGRLAQDANFANRDQSRWWWMSMLGAPVTGYDLDRDEFIGVYNSFHNPQTVTRGKCGNTDGNSDNICGAIQSDIELAAGESRDIMVLMGAGKAGEVGKKACKEFGTPERAAKELEKLKAHWHGLLKTYQTKTPDGDLDHMVNVWNAYNALITYEWSRACSLIYTGDNRDGLGYRDSLQDVLGVTCLIPKLAKERLELMLSGQDATGGAQPEIRPWLHKPGQMKPTPEQHYRSDDGLWFFNVIPAYLAETGDMAFLDQQVPYADKGTATVLGHMRRALDFNLERTGLNGLPCGLAADWNDCLKLGFKGESVFVAFQVRLGLSVYADLCGRKGMGAEKQWALENLKALDEKIKNVCWDGQWFIWAIGEDATIYGNQKAAEGRIYLNTQVWAVMSGAASKEQTDKCLDAVKEQLATPYGVMLCTPPFDKTPVKVMRAVLFNPGNKENGGIFSHTQSWAVIAEAMRGNGNQAYEYYRAYMPAAYNDRAQLRQIEPFAHCQSTHGKPSPKFGVSRVPWLSGTVSWSYYTATQWILGVRPEIDGLRIDPCIPAEWKEFSVERQFRGKKLSIHVTNPGGVQRGVKSITVNGKNVSGNLLAVADLAAVCKIEVVMG